MSELNYNLVDNKEKKQYEFHIEGHIARIEYIVAKDEIFLTHTEVPTILEGKGIASALVEKVLTDIEQHGLRLIPLCPFVATYIKKHPAWKRIIMKGIHV
jgi:predicted GNAT family acetyltransferase